MPSHGAAATTHTHPVGPPMLDPSVHPASGFYRGRSRKTGLGRQNRRPEPPFSLKQGSGGLLRVHAAPSVRFAWASHTNAAPAHPPDPRPLLPTNPARPVSGVVSGAFRRGLTGKPAGRRSPDLLKPAFSGRYNSNSPSRRTYLPSQATKQSFEWARVPPGIALNLVQGIRVRGAPLLEASTWP